MFPLFGINEDTVRIGGHAEERADDPDNRETPEPCDSGVSTRKRMVLAEDGGFEPPE